MATSVYILCMITSAFCAALLLREYRRTSARILLWSSLSFAGWALNNAFVFMDLVVFPNIDFSMTRTATSLIAVTLMLYGLVWDAT